MSARSNAGRRSLVVASAVLAAALLFAPAMPVLAQATADPRWNAWLGCWEPADAELRVIGDAGRTQRTCVIPAAGVSAVDIVTVTGGAIAERTHLDANGERRSVTRNGCTGWESAEWAETGYRVYVRSEYTCEGGVKRAESGLLAFSATGEWLDLRSVTAGGASGVRVYRFREVTDLGGMPAEVGAALRDRALSVSAARTAASLLTLGDIADASRVLDSGVAGAWLIERSRDFTMKVDGTMLTQLADAGVAPSVIDVMVALAHPKVFAVNPATREAGLRPVETAGGRATEARALRVIGYDAYGLPVYDYEFAARCAYSRIRRLGCPVYGYSPYGYYDPFFGYSLYGYPYVGNGYRYGYGYGAYGYGYRTGYGWYPGTQPVVVVIQDLAPERPHGRVVNGRGYSEGGSRTSTGPSTSTSSGSGSATSGSSAGSGASSGSAAGGAGASSSAGRTAVPRKP